MKRKKEINFLTHCLAKNYSEDEIIKAFLEIRVKKDNRFLIYFMNSQKSDDPKVRKIAKVLSSTLGPDMLWGKLPYLARCQRSKNTKVASLAAELIQYSMRIRKSEEKIEKLDYLISSQRSRSKAVRKFANGLAQTIEIRDFAKQLDTLISYCNDKNLWVRKFTSKYAIKTLSCNGFPAAKKEEYFDFIMSCTEKKENSSFLNDARDLSLTIMANWPVEKLTPHLNFLFACCEQLSSGARCLAMELAMKVVSTWPYQKRKEKLDFFIQCWRNKDYHDYKTQPMSLELALGIIRYFPEEKIAEHLSLLIACQKFEPLRKLSRRLAFKLKNEVLIVHENKIDNYVKEINGFDNYHTLIMAVELKLKLMANWNSEKLADNLWHIFVCHNTDKKHLQLKAKKLALAIEAKDLVGKARRVINQTFSTRSEEYLTRNIAIGQYFKINPDELLTNAPEALDDHCDIKKYRFLKQLTFMIEPSKLDIAQLFKIDGYYHLGSLLALRAMKNWKAQDLKPYTQSIFLCTQVDRNSEVVNLAKKIYQEIKEKEFSAVRISRAKRMILARI